jgi:flavodoxin
MKVGIIIHSCTGNTLSVAEKIREELISMGHTAEIEMVAAVDEKETKIDKIKLKAAPDPKAYRALIFGAPVHGFMLSPVMRAYLSQIPSLKGRKINCFVTEQFPYAWMGGNRAIRDFKLALKFKDTTALETGVINWSNKERDKMIKEVVEKMVKLS